MTAKPDGMPEVVKALVPWLDRFMAKVEVQPNGCHLWTAAKTNKGYGKLTIDGKTVSAHRASWFIATGEWPSLCILHRCDTPACVNHAHHKLGTCSGQQPGHDRQGPLQALWRSQRFEPSPGKADGPRRSRHSIASRNDLLFCTRQ